MPVAIRDVSAGTDYVPVAIRDVSAGTDYVPVAIRDVVVGQFEFAATTRRASLAVKHRRMAG